MRVLSAIPVTTRVAAAAAPTSSPLPTTGKELIALRRALLRWYDQHRRDLPWRETRDPYRVWLSEIMLQQTRVAAVLEYYRLFLERFPNIEALAAAPEDDVLTAWSGLGYYRRARMLHQCAKEIVEKNFGRFPQRAEDLRNLPGIGRYTAAAIASIAFAERIAVVDGNVERVLRRLTGIALPAPQTWQFAQALLATSRPGDFNQAMMELGATVCVPGEPRCLMCPVRKWCVTQADIPRTRTEAPFPQKKKHIWCALDWRRGTGDSTNEIRLVQRPKKASLMPGMWELPQSPEPPHRIPADEWRTFRHSITVTDYTVHVVRNTSLAASARAAKGRWIAVERIPQIPLTGLTRKILRASGII